MPLRLRGGFTRTYGWIRRARSRLKVVNLSVRPLESERCPHTACSCPLPWTARFPGACTAPGCPNAQSHSPLPPLPVPVCSAYIGI